MEEPSAYARALRPDRPRMLECLVTLTSAPERVDHASPVVRVAALRALGDHGNIPAEVCVARLEDADERVRDAAAEVLQGLDGALAALRGVPVSRFGTRVRSLFVGLAWRARDERWLRALAAQDHPWVRGLALTALRELGALAPEELTAAACDEDPWTRAAALGPVTAPGMFVNDPDPELRRAALERVLASRRLVTGDVRHAAVSSRDAWVRARAPSLLDARTDDGMRALVALFRDPSLAVRSAALDALDAARATERVLASIASTPGLTEPTPRPVLAIAHQGEGRPASTPHRVLGDTGLRVSPLGLSGVYELPSRGYAMAEERGVNLFFWEPHYTRLTRHLQRAPSRDGRVIVAGSFHATDAAITRDIERALRTLGRDHVDVFLLFWTRSRARLNDETLGCLERARRAGKVRAIGFSTHDRALAGLTTYRPKLDDGAVAWPGVLAQGAPTSPALANLVCLGMDERLAKLAEKVGAAYTRYADDMTFSFKTEPAVDIGRFLWWVDQICQQEGFVENTAKRKVLRRGNQQRVTGVVVNSGLFVPREARRRFKAIVQNCRVHGVDSQSRGHPAFRQYLRGFAAYVKMVQPEHGAELVSAVRELLAAEKTA